MADGDKPAQGTDFKATDKELSGKNFNSKDAAEVLKTTFRAKVGDNRLSGPIPGEKLPATLSALRDPPAAKAPTPEKNSVVVEEAKKEFGKKLGGAVWACGAFIVLGFVGAVIGWGPLKGCVNAALWGAPTASAISASTAVPSGSAAPPTSSASHP